MHKPPIWKPIVTPAAFTLANTVLALWSGQMPQWLLGALLGVSVLWLLIAMASARGNAVKRWPWLREWAPFLDPRGGFSNIAELTKTHVQGHTFRIAELGAFGAIMDRTFEDCAIWGPCVILLGDGFNRFDECVVNNDRSILHYPREDQDGFVGVVPIPGCHFRRCHFYGVGFTGPSTALDAVSKELVFFEPSPDEPPHPVPSARTRRPGT